MSPVGSYESLAAAIQAGADSVYFGVGALNMRSKSSKNFTLDDLEEITRICGKNGVRSYLALNTVIFDHELEEMKQYVKAAKEKGITAIIAADMSVIQYARSQGMEVHMSTQTNVTNIEAVKFYAQFADVMVTARELSLKQVAEITRQIGEQDIRGPGGEWVQIEVFVHGALCMAVSGKCYLSLDNLNSSANRGACLQQCRRKYMVTDKETGTELEVDNEYIMSPKDLSTVAFLDKVIKAGVKVLKIEGRGRSADYVKAVTEVYSEAVEAVCSDTFTKDKIKLWDQKLATVYNRGFWDGYYLGKKLGEWTENYGSQATQKKVYVGKITNYFSKLSVAELTMETQLIEKGNQYKIIGPTTGVVEGSLDEIRVNLEVVEKCSKGEICSFRVPELVRRGDKVYRVDLVKEEF